jgi:hypothetical protein
MSNADCAQSRRCAETGFGGDDSKDDDDGDVEVNAEDAAADANDAACDAAEEYEDEVARSRGGCSRILSNSC